MKRILLMIVVIAFVAGCAAPEKKQPAKKRLMPDKSAVK